MNKKIRLLAVSFGVIAMMSGAVIWLTPESGVDMRSEAAAIGDVPSPQGVQLAQAPTGTPAGGTGSGLPGGASSLNETYRDWRVVCAQQGNQKRCALSQAQVQQNGQRILAIELNAPTGNAVSGILILPFGLAFESGVGLQIDEKPPLQPLRFRTCVPGGCIVSLAFDAPALIALRAGTALKIKAVADGGEAMPLSISLQGFGTALDRVGALSR